LKTIFLKLFYFGPNGNFNKGNVLNEYKLNTRQEMALTEINEGNGLTIKHYSIMFKISRSTALRDLNALVKYGLIRKINKGKQFYFIHL
jgi:Fic family protein